jgi:hypothetical protein
MPVIEDKITTPPAGLPSNMATATPLGPPGPSGAWNAYRPVLLPGRLPYLGRGRTVLVTERDQASVRHGRRGGALSEPFPRTLG